MQKEKTKRKKKVSPMFIRIYIYNFNCFLGKSKVVINENQLSEVVNIETMKSQLQKSLDQLKEDFIKHVSLRSTTGTVDY